MQRYSPNIQNNFNKQELLRLDELIIYIAKRMGEKYEKISKAFKFFDINRVR